MNNNKQIPTSNITELQKNKQLETLLTNNKKLKYRIAELLFKSGKILSKNINLEKENKILKDENSKLILAQQTEELKDIPFTKSSDIGYGVIGRVPPQPKLLLESITDFLEQHIDHINQKLITDAIKTSAIEYLTWENIESVYKTRTSFEDTLLEFLTVKIPKNSLYKKPIVLWYKILDNTITEQQHRIIQHILSKHNLSSINSKDWNWIVKIYVYMTSLVDMDQWKIGRSQTEFMSLSDRNRFSILNKIITYTPSEPSVGTLTKNNVMYLHSHLDSKYFKRLNKFKIIFKIYPSQPTFLYCEPYGMRHIPPELVKLHISFNVDLSYQEILIDAYEMLLDCLFATREGYEIYSSCIIRIKIAGLIYLNPCPKGQHTICKTLIQYNRDTPHIVLYPIGGTIKEQQDNIQTIGNYIRRYFQDNWKKPFPIAGTSQLMFNIPLPFDDMDDRYEDNYGGKYFLQYATSGAGNNKMDCIDAITILEKKNRKISTLEDIIINYRKKHRTTTIQADIHAIEHNVFGHDTLPNDKHWSNILKNLETKVFGKISNPSINIESRLYALETHSHIKSTINEKLQDLILMDSKLHKALLDWWNISGQPLVLDEAIYRSLKSKVRQAKYNMIQVYDSMDIGSLEVGCSDNESITMPNEINIPDLRHKCLIGANGNYNWSIPEDVPIISNRVDCSNPVIARNIIEKYGSEYCRMRKDGSYNGKQLNSVCINTGDTSTRYCTDFLCFN